MPRPLAALLLLICTMLWGFAFIAQKSALLSMGPLAFAGVRYLLGGLLVLPLALWEHRRVARPLSRRDWALTLAVSFVFFMGSWLQNAGLLSTTATNAGFLTGLYVFFVPLLGFAIFRTRPHPIILLCVPLALVGLYFLNGGGSFNSGDMTIVVSAVFWAFHVLLLGLVARSTGQPIFVSAVSFLFAGVVSLALSLLIEQPSFDGILAGWMEIAYAGILSTAVAFTFQAIGQQYVPPANAAIILSAESLFAALGSALLLGERLPPVGYAGAALVFAAIVAAEAVPPLLARRSTHMPRPTN